MKETAIRIQQETGRPVTFVSGAMQVETPSGVRRVRGVITERGVIVQADNFSATAEQIAEHEIFHDYVKKDPGMLDEVEAAIANRYGEEEVDAMLDVYLKNIRGVYDSDDDMTEEQYQQALDYAREEMCADAFAGINSFGVEAGSFREEARSAAESRRDVRSREVQVERETGPPDGRNVTEDTGYDPYGLDSDEYILQLREQLARGEITDEEHTRLLEEYDEGGNGSERYSVEDSFADEVQTWHDEGMPEGEQFILGSTGEVLQGLGAVESDIYINGDKIAAIFEKHPEMTIREIRRIPEILDDPVLVLKSKGSGQRSNSRLVMMGSIKAQNGKPVLAVMDLRPMEKGFVLEDFQKVNSAYTKENGANFVRTSEVLYADKKRTIPLLRSIGLTIASRPLLRDGSVGSITYFGKSVNIEGVKFSEVVKESGRYSVDDSFADEVQTWYDSTDKLDRLRDRGYVLVGDVPETLRELGADGRVFWRKMSMARSIENHPEIDIEMVKRIPEIMEDPVAVAVRGEDGRIRMLADAGDGIVASWDIRQRAGNKIWEAELSTMDANRAKAILRGAELLYLDEEKVRELMDRARADLKGRAFGAVGSIREENGKLTVEGKTLEELGGKIETRKKERKKKEKPQRAAQPQETTEITEPEPLTQPVEESPRAKTRCSKKTTFLLAIKAHMWYDRSSICKGKDNYGTASLTPTTVCRHPRPLASDPAAAAPPGPPPCVFLLCLCPELIVSERHVRFV